MSPVSSVLSAATILQAAHLFRAQYDLATIAVHCGVSEEALFARLESVKRVAEAITS